ncbi:MAG: hypothetical protein MMC33_008738 [Icmadophila ericetorum]|nr:hypothetical protein [Icmadophila ericetorum]
MLFTIISFAIVLSTLSVASSSSPVTSLPSDTTTLPPVYKNANHIFNAIHSSMRQWGSTLNHNGMSFFPAYLPAGTELYHGTGTVDVVKGMEWLAFEPEHALDFAWKFVGPLANHFEDQDSMLTKWVLDSDLYRNVMQRTLETGQDDFYQQLHDGIQHPLHRSGRSTPRPPSELQPGWLHTYVMKHDLRLVYLDGLSAAKSNKGTLDSQNFILSLGGERWSDYLRAMRMCKLAAEEWNGRIDGFIRTEHGFELILCDFESSADLIRVVRANETFAFGNGEDGAMRFFSFMKAITARYHGIGMSRTSLDYSRMVTAFAYDIDLFTEHETDLPRLKYISEEDRAKIVADLSKSIMHEDDHQPTPPQWTNWQAIADMIIARYSNTLHELASSPVYTCRKRLDLEITLSMRPFIDYDNRNTTLELHRCTSHFIPRNHTSSIASAAVTHISNRICSTFFFAGAATTTTLDAQRSFQDLVAYLQWTSWKECRGCKYDELCFTAIWPFGNMEDHVRPSCRNGTGMVYRRDYWRR